MHIVLVPRCTYCYRCLCGIICLLRLCFMQKMAWQTGMSFWGETLWDLQQVVLDGDADPPWKGGTVFPIVDVACRQITLPCCSVTAVSLQLLQCHYASLITLTHWLKFCSTLLLHCIGLDVDCHLKQDCIGIPYACDTGYRWQFV